MTTPVFTTSHPGFMASTEARNREFIAQHDGPKSLAPQCIGIPVYIDGDLQRLLGYDIPIWLSGDVTGETQEVLIWNVDGTRCRQAELTWNWVGPWDSRGYIRLPPGVKIFEYKSFGATLAFAESLGFDAEKIDQEMERGTTNAGSEEFIADCLEEAALEFIQEQGYTIEYPEEIQHE